MCVHVAHTLVLIGDQYSIVVLLHPLHLLPNLIDNFCQLIYLKRKKKEFLVTMSLY